MPPRSSAAAPCLLPILPLLLWDGHSVSIQATGPDSQDGTWQDPASPKNYQQLDTAQGTLRPTQCSVCPLTATKHVLPPTHSRSDLARCLPTSSCIWQKGKPLVYTFSPQNTPAIPSTRGHSGLGTDRHCPLASLAHHIELFSPLPL